MSDKTDKKIGMTVGMMDSADLGAIFVLFLKDSLKHFLEQTGRYFMFPFAAFASIIVAVLAWRDAARANDKTSLVVKALVETLAATAITVAVVGGFVGGAAFAALAVPLIFTGAIAIRTLHSIGSSIYYGVKAALTKNDTDYKAYKKLAIHNAVSSVAGLFATVAVVGVMILAKPLLGIFGIAAAAIGAVFTGKLAFDMYNKSKAEAKPDPEKEPLLAEEASQVNQPDVVNDVNFNSEPQNANRLVEEPVVGVANEEFAQHKVDFGVFSHNKVDTDTRGNFTDIVVDKPSFQNA